MPYTLAKLAALSIALSTAAIDKLVADTSTSDPCAARLMGPLEDSSTLLLPASVKALPDTPTLPALNARVVAATSEVYPTVSDTVDTPLSRRDVPPLRLISPDALPTTLPPLLTTAVCDPYRLVNALCAESTFTASSARLVDAKRSRRAFARKETGPALAASRLLAP